METEHDILLKAMMAEVPGHGPAYQAYMDYLSNEPACVKLLREAQSDEETFVWYAEQDCKTKGYQWYQASQQKYVTLVSYMVGMLNGFSIDEVNQQIVAAYEAVLPEGEA